MATKSSSMPDEVEIMRMVNARRKEIVTLESEVKAKLPKQNIQRLPRVMRRRAASNNPSRVPKSCRGKWFKSLIDDKTSKAKEKKRNQMKKHVSKTKEKESIRRRNERSDRSLLHIWFAKRFKMEKINGYWVPIKNSTKNQRSLFRKAKEQCVYYYMSPFFRCFEVKSSQETVSQALSSPENISKIGTYDFVSSEDLIGTNKCYHCVVPVEVLKVSESTCHVWTHIGCMSNVEQLLSVIPDTEIRVADLERIRLVGSTAKLRIKSYLGIELPESLQSIHIQDNLVFFSGNIGDQRSFIDIIISKSETKILWNKLVKNRGHLVGGIRNLTMLSFNSSVTHFPTFGFPDFDGNRQKFPWEEIAGDPEFSVIRGKTLNELIQHQPDLTSLANVIREKLHDKHLITVKIVSIGKGTPNEGSFICIPKLEDLDNESNLEVPFHAHDSISSCPRAVAGFVEFGEFCLEEGTGKGIGCIASRHLLKIIQQNHQKGHQHLNCLFLNNNSCKLRLSRLVIIK